VDKDVEARPGLLGRFHTGARAVRQPCYAELFTTFTSCTAIYIASIHRQHYDVFLSRDLPVSLSVS
jgi:hypothetical protein